MSLIEILNIKPTWVLSIIGPGGSGKTTKAFYLLDEVFTGDIFIFKYPEHLRENFPEHMRSRITFFETWEEIAGRPGTVFLDDMAIHFLSRSSNSTGSKDFISTLTIGRHQGHRYIVTAQNSVLNDKGLYESLDQYTIRCRMTLTQTLTEREEYIELQQGINEIIDEVLETHPELDPRSITVCPETDEILIFPNWPHMTDELSTPYRGAYIEGGKLQFT